MSQWRAPDSAKHRRAPESRRSWDGEPTARIIYWQIPKPLRDEEIAERGARHSFAWWFVRFAAAGVAMWAVAGVSVWLVFWR